jgi:molybdenum cofactor biosynthesis protein A
MSGKKIESKNFITDRFGRIHNYLRLSITEGCNYACTYCMPHGSLASSSNIMSAEEIGEISKQMVDLGVNKIRITGGEPLIRKDFANIIELIGKLPIERALTTNGFLLNSYFNQLIDSNFKKLNVSLDTLDAARYKEITGRNVFNQVFENIFKAIDLGFKLKLNMVVMKGINDSEIIDFAKLTLNNPITVRFIEFMPFPGNNWNFGRTIKCSDILEKLKLKYEIEEVNNNTIQTSKNHKIKGAKGELGVISTVSNPFCNECNRIRLTADGKLKNCLFNNGEVDVLSALRQEKSIANIVSEVLSKKHLQQGSEEKLSVDNKNIQDNRNMYSIGG